MKKPKLEKQIRQDFRLLVPDQPPKVVLSDYFPEVEVVKKARLKIQLVRYFVGAMAVLVIAIGFFIAKFYPGLISTTTAGIVTTEPHGTTSTDSNTQTDSTTITSRYENPVTSLNATEYASGIITASKLFLNLYPTSANALSLDIPVANLLVDDYVDLMANYLNVMELAVGHDSPYVTLIENSDRSEYQYCLVTSGVNLTGEIENYRLYYTVTNATDSEVEMIGIMIWGSAETKFTGKMETEANEQKLMITSYDESNPENYIETELELETNEQEYSIRVYTNSILTIDSMVEIEIESSESKITVSVMTSEDEFDFVIKKEIENNEAETSIEYSIISGLSTESGAVIVELRQDDESGKYYYYFQVTTGDIEKEFFIDRLLPDDVSQENQYMSFFL